MSTKRKNKEATDKFKKHPSDTGSAAYQVAVLTDRINLLSKHFKENTKDHVSRRGFLKLIDRRKKLLRYIMGRNKAEHENLVKNLNLA